MPSRERFTCRGEHRGPASNVGERTLGVRKSQRIFDGSGEVDLDLAALAVFLSAGLTMPGWSELGQRRARTPRGATDRGRERAEQ